MVIEHLRPREQVLGHRKGAVRVAGQEHALGQLGGRLEVIGPNLVLESQATNVIAPRLASVAKRRSSPADLREAVERTVQATLGSADRQRERTQGALDDLGAGIARRGKAVVGAIEDRRPATYEDMRELQEDLRRISRRLDAIEKRLPAKRSSQGKKRK